MYGLDRSVGALCELLPQPDNRVARIEEKDRNGPPVAKFVYSATKTTKP